MQAVEGTRLIRMQAFVGKRTPAHASALGKVLLAHLPAAELDRLLAGCVLSGFTPNTLTDPDALRTELHRIRAQGWGWTTRRSRPACGVSACPSPTIPAASPPASRYRLLRHAWSPSDISALLPRLQDTASRISRHARQPDPTTAAPEHRRSPWMANTMNGADIIVDFLVRAERAVPVRPVRARQCRIPGCRVQSAEPHPHHLGRITSRPPVTWPMPISR